MQSLSLLLLFSCMLFLSLSYHSAYGISSDEIIAETITIYDVTLNSNEIIVLLDTTGISSLELVSVTANLPCDTENNPEVKILAGVFGNMVNVIDSNSAYTGFSGPDNTCVFRSLANASASQGLIIDSLILINEENNPITLPKLVTVTLTGSFGATSSGNSAPIANAGSDQIVSANTLVQLDGSASSDPDGNILTYSWTKVQGPTIPNGLSDSGSITPTFTAPEVSSPTSFVFELEVTDGPLTDTDMVTILVNPVLEVIDLSNLLIYYQFENSQLTGTTLENQASIANGASNGLGSSANGNVVGATVATSGKINDSFKFDDNDRVSSVTTSVNGEFTFATWAKSTYAEEDNVFAYMFDMRDGSNHLYMMVDDNNNGLIRCHLGGTHVQTTSDSRFNDGLWHHYACTRDSNNVITLYIDGQPEASAQSSVSINTVTLRVGNNILEDRPWIGELDEFSVWSRALSSFEIANLYNSGIGLPIIP